MPAEIQSATESRCLVIGCEIPVPRQFPLCAVHRFSSPVALDRKLMRSIDQLPLSPTPEQLRQVKLNHGWAVGLFVCKSDRN